MENDPGHLGRLLQLILGVAINCDSKTDHIQALLTMEQDVQRVVMMAIQVREQNLNLFCDIRKKCRSWQEREGSQALPFQQLRMMLRLLSSWRLVSYRLALPSPDISFYVNIKMTVINMCFIYLNHSAKKNPLFQFYFTGHGKHQVWEGAACPKVPRFGNATQSHEGGKVQLVRYIFQDFKPIQSISSSSSPYMCWIKYWKPPKTLNLLLHSIWWQMLGGVGHSWLLSLQRLLWSQHLHHLISCIPTNPHWTIRNELTY